MTLDQWLEQIESQHPSEIELGLDRVEKVFASLDIQHRLPFSLIVAGTNGKGSTVAAIRCGLESLGLKVGCYTSPHISRFNERITIMGQDVSDDLLIKAFKRVESARGDTALTYFEFTTLAAFVVFADLDIDQKLDAIVCEVGLGGRLDAVNILDADVSIVTGIGLDHQDWLGNSLNQIAREKAGVFRKGRTGLVGESFPSETLTELRAEGYILKTYGQDFGHTFDGGSARCFWAFDEPVHVDCIQGSLLPANNLCLAMQACCLTATHLLHDRSDEALLNDCADAIASVRVAGRVEQVCENPLTILDVAHNAQAAAFLARYVESQFTGNKPLAVFSCLKDKDIREIVASITGHFDHWYVAQLDNSRAMPLEHIKHELVSQGESVRVFETIAGAFESAKSQAIEEQRPLMVFGSFFVLEALREKARTR